MENVGLIRFILAKETQSIMGAIKGLKSFSFVVSNIISLLFIVILLDLQFEAVSAILVLLAIINIETMVVCQILAKILARRLDVIVTALAEWDDENVADGTLLLRVTKIWKSVYMAYGAFLMVSLVCVLVIVQLPFILLGGF